MGKLKPQFLTCLLCMWFQWQSSFQSFCEYILFVPICTSQWPFWNLGSGFPFVSVLTASGMRFRVRSTRPQLGDVPRISYTTLWDHLLALPSSPSPLSFLAPRAPLSGLLDRKAGLWFPLCTSCNFVCLCSHATKRWRERKKMGITPVLLGL